jgi:hypothetical protein
MRVCRHASCTCTWQPRKNACAIFTYHNQPKFEYLRPKVCVLHAEVSNKRTEDGADRVEHGTQMLVVLEAEIFIQLGGTIEQPPCHLPAAASAMHKKQNECEQLPTDVREASAFCSSDKGACWTSRPWSTAWRSSACVASVDDARMMRMMRMTSNHRFWVIRSLETALLLSAAAYRRLASNGSTSKAR